MSKFLGKGLGELSISLPFQEKINTHTLNEGKNENSKKIISDKIITI